MKVYPTIKRYERCIEIAHFYLNDIFKVLRDIDSPELDYLNNWEFSYRDSLFVLIDDKFAPVEMESKIKIKTHIWNYFSKRFGITVNAVFESSFMREQDEIARIYNERKPKPILDWWLNIAKYNSDKKPSCLLLSTAWARQRLENYDEVVTIIDKKYKNLERQVREFFLPEDRKRYKLIWV